MSNNTRLVILYLFFTWVGFCIGYTVANNKVSDIMAKHYHEKYELEDKLKECRAKIREYEEVVFDCVE